MNEENAPVPWHAIHLTHHILILNVPLSTHGVQKHMCTYMELDWYHTTRTACLGGTKCVCVCVCFSVVGRVSNESFVKHSAVWEGQGWTALPE